MRNIILTVLAITALFYARTVVASSPTALSRRDENDISSRLSSLVSSATHALDEEPLEATSILSELRERYASIAGEATGCGSSWSRVTNAVGEFDDGIFDGIANLADEIFGDGDECENAASKGTIAYGIVGAGLLGVAAVL